jgi:arylsulfatase A-like enzyme
VVKAKHRAVRTEQWKLYYAPTTAGARVSLYDVRSDPEERANVVAEHPDEAKQLRALLDEWLTLDALPE